MKFTIALFLGVISANQLEDLQDQVDLLKIRVSKAGQRSIEKEMNDVGNVAKEIKSHKAVRNLKNSFEKFAMSKEIANIKKIDKAFLASPEGKELVHEWMDVGHVLDEHLYKNKNGIHFPNEHMDELSDELNDVVHEYEQLEGSKWDKAYSAGWKAAFESKAGKQLGRRVKTFSETEEAKMLKKEIMEVKAAVKKHVKVTELPDHWKKEANLLKVEVSPEGQEAIEKEFNDIHDVMEDVKMSAPVRNMKNSLEKWGMSPEVAALKKLDQEFLASPEGKELVAEWKDFGEALKSHIKETKNGIHIDDEGMQIIQDEADDVEHEYKMLHGSEWEKKYDAAWKAATSSKQAEQLGRRFDTFSKSDEWKMIETELKELDAALKKHVKVTDLPKDMQAQMELLKIHVSKQGQAKIEKEMADVGSVMKKIKMAKSVRNLKSSLERWAKSDEVAAIKKLDKAFWASPEGQELFHEMKDFHDALKDHVKKTKTGIHIDNEGLQVIEDEADDVEHEYKMLHGSKWDKAYEAAWKKATSSPEAASVQRRAETFGKSAEWKALSKELKELDAALKKNVKVTDLPKDDMYLF